MKTQKHIIDDLAKLATGAVCAVGGAKEEVQTMIKQKIGRYIAELDLVSHDEFDAMSEVARMARAETKSLKERITELEKKFEALSTSSSQNQTGKTVPKQKDKSA